MPYIPCHRIIATNLFIGGFSGEWGPHDGTGIKVPRKLALLKEEGVTFTKEGFLDQTEGVRLWTP